MSSGVGYSRVPIPTNVRKLIHNIREITGKQHSDDEIFSVLQDCSMDPNETAQKLLHLDTFHEVKSRRDRRKENLDSKPSEESRPTTGGGHRRVARGGGQGNFSSDTGGGRNAARRENGTNHTADRGPMFSKTKHNATARPTKATTPSGTANLPNGSSHHHDVNKSGAPSPSPELDVIVTSSPTFGSLGTVQGKSPPKSDRQSISTTPTTIAAAHPSSDSIAAAPPLGGLSVIECEDRSQELPAESNLYNGDKNIADDIVVSESEKGINGAVNVTHEEKSPGKPKSSERSPLSETSQPPSLSTYQAVASEVAAVAVEVSSRSASELNVSDGQQVTFPTHFQVPETLKSGLTFGSFDASFGPKGESVSDHHANVDASESTQEHREAAIEPSSRIQNVSENVQEDYPDNAQSFTEMLEKLSTSEANISSSTDSKGEHSKQETQLPPEVTQNPAILNWHHYGLGIMSPMIGSQVVQMEGHESQSHETHLPNFATGNSLVQSTTNPAPPVPNSMAVTPQSVPVFRQTYPPNFFPYGQYISPFYMPPMHQFLSPNGFPPQPSTGNVYLPPAGAGVKYTLPQYKPGNNSGNPTHIGIQSGGSFITAPVGYAQPVASGSSGSNEDLMSSHLKENRIYTAGQLSEGSPVWFHAGGQDVPSLQVNSLYNIPPQHLAFSPQQPGHGAFAGIFPPAHAMTTPSTLLQQSQAMAGVTDAMGPPSGAYQQPQHSQINWNSAF